MEIKIKKCPVCGSKRFRKINSISEVKAHCEVCGYTCHNNSFEKVYIP